MKRKLAIAFMAILLGVTVLGALDKADYRGGVFFTDRHNAVIAGFTSDGYFEPLAGINLLDDIDLSFGGTAGGTIGPFTMEWTTADAVANCFLLDLPTGGVTDVPVVILASSDTDFNYFEGTVEPTLAIENLAGTGWVGLDHSATTLARLYAGGADTFLTIATELAGSDIVFDAADAAINTAQQYVSIVGSTPAHTTGTLTDIFLDITPTIGIHAGDGTYGVNLIDLSFTSPVWVTGGATSTIRGIYFNPTIGDATAGTNVIVGFDIPAITDGDEDVDIYGLRAGNMTQEGGSQTANVIDIGTGWDDGLTSASPVTLTGTAADLTVNTDDFVVDADGNITIASTLDTIIAPVGTDLSITANSIQTGTWQLGSDGTGYAATWYGDTAGDYMQWSDANMRLTITGPDAATALDVADGNVVIDDDLTVHADDFIVDADGNITIAPTLDIIMAPVGTDLSITANSIQTGTWQLGSDGSGYTATWYGDTAGDYMDWSDTNMRLTITGPDAATALDVAAGNVLCAEDFTVHTDDFVVDADGNITINPTLDVVMVPVGGDLFITADSIQTGTWRLGSDGTGYTATWYGDTAGDYMAWSDTNMRLTITGPDAATALEVDDGNVVIADDFTVNSDDFVVDADSDIHMAPTGGEVRVLGDTIQTGSITITVDLDVDGTANLDDVDIDGDTDFAGKIVLGGAWGATPIDLDGTDTDQAVQFHADTTTDVTGGAYATVYDTMTITSSLTGDVSNFALWSELYYTGAITKTWSNDAAIYGNLEIADSAGLIHFNAGHTDEAWTAGIASNIITPDGLRIGDYRDIAGFYAISTIATGYTQTGTDSMFAAYIADAHDQPWPIGYYVKGEAATIGIQVGDDDDGCDVEIYGDTAGAGVAWDASDDAVELDGTANITHEDATNSGVVFCSAYNIDHTQTGSAVTLFTIPINSYVKKVEVVTTTTFDDSGTVTIDIGWSGHTQDYASGLDIQTASYTLGDEYDYIGVATDAERTIIATMTGSNADGTTGAATIYLEWTMFAPGSG